MKYLRRLTRNESILLKKYKLSIENSLCRKECPAMNTKNTINWYSTLIHFKYF